MIEKLKTEIQVLDVRKSGEYKSGHLQNVNHIELSTIEKNLRNIPQNKDLFIHCRGGGRSTIAISILRKNGFTNNLFNIAGGFDKLVENGAKVVKE